MLQLSTVDDDAQFAALGSVWGKLLSRSEGANVFHSHEWLHSWWTAYRPAARLCILLLKREERLVAIAPLMLCRETRFGLPVNVLRFIGDGTWETDHIGFLIDRDEHDEAAGRLLAAVESLGWDIAEFNQMPANAASTRALLAFAGARWRVEIVEKPCPRSELPPTYEQLVAAMPARFRTTLRSSRRKLEQQHRVEFGLHASHEELSEALDTLFRNHAGRWQAKGEGGVFGDGRRRAFYAMLSPRLLERGWLRFFYLKLDGRVVAQQFCFGIDDTTMLLQEGFDIDLAKENLGNTLRGFVFEHLISSGGRVYDFLAGESRHKRNWSNANLDDLRITCIRRSLYGGAIGAAMDAVEAAKRLLRPLRDRLRSQRPEAQP